MRLLDRVRAYAALRPRRNISDYTRYLVRRPALMLAVGTYEAATLASNRVDLRLKYLAVLKTSSLVGCGF